MKAALITGSSKGIGRAIAGKLAVEGYFVFVTYLTDQEGAQKVHEEIGKKRSRILKLDVREEDSVKQVMEAVREEKGQLDVLVNNAGVEVPKQIEEISFAEWKQVLNTKINGVFLCAKYALPLLKKSVAGNVINLTSSMGDNPNYRYPAYCTATAGVDVLTKVLAVDFARYGIRTNAVSPGETLTPMWESLGGTDPQLWERFAKENPMGRVCTVEDIAEVVWMIISDKTQFLNGNTIYVNGGNHLK